MCSAGSLAECYLLEECRVFQVLHFLRKTQIMNLLKLLSKIFFHSLLQKGQYFQPKIQWLDVEFLYEYLKLLSATFDIRKLPHLRVNFLFLAFTETKKNAPDVNIIIQWFRTQINVILEPGDVLMFLRYVTLFELYTTDCLTEYDAFQMVLFFQILNVIGPKDTWCRHMTQLWYRQQEARKNSSRGTSINLWNGRNKVLPLTLFENVEGPCCFRTTLVSEDKATHPGEVISDSCLTVVTPQLSSIGLPM